MKISWEMKAEKTPIPGIFCDKNLYFMRFIPSISILCEDVFVAWLFCSLYLSLLRKEHLFNFIVNKDLHLTKYVSKLCEIFR
jgi:hypothetical protein